MAQHPSNPHDILIRVLAPSTHQDGDVQSTPTSTTAKSPSQSDGSLEAPKTEANESDHFLEGFKLYVIVGGLMLVGFLVALNGSFVATVSLSLCFDFLQNTLTCVCLLGSIIFGWIGCMYRSGLCIVALCRDRSSPEYVSVVGHESDRV